MRGFTHAAVGAAIGAAAVPACPAAGAAVGALAALLPDVDHPGSTIGRRLRPLAVLLEEIWGHRSLTHTLWFALPAGLALGLLALWLGLPAGCLLAGAAGGLSHLALDALTRSGVEPFAPWGPRLRGPILTGGALDVLVGILLAAVALVAAGR
jgi:inner membrane protein